MPSLLRKKFPQAFRAEDIKKDTPQSYRLRTNGAPRSTASEPSRTRSSQPAASRLLASQGAASNLHGGSRAENYTEWKLRNELARLRVENEAIKRDHAALHADLGTRAQRAIAAAACERQRALKELHEESCAFNEQICKMEKLAACKDRELEMLRTSVDKELARLRTSQDAELETLRAANEKLKEEYNFLERKEQTKFERAVAAGEQDKEYALVKLRAAYHENNTALSTNLQARSDQVQDLRKANSELRQINAELEKENLRLHQEACSLTEAKLALEHERMAFIACPECKRCKAGVAPLDVSCGMNDHPRHFREKKCPTCTLCMNCLKPKFERAIVSGWWYNLYSPRWLECPVAGCVTPLDIDCVDGLKEVIRDFSDEDQHHLIRLYRQALKLREALARVAPSPDLDAISMSIGLHQQLSAFGFLEDAFSGLDGYGSPVEVGEVFMADLERSEARVPVFTNLLHRSCIPRDCSICSESFHELDIESAEQWAQVCEGYEGPWMAEMLSVPSKETLLCNHNIDVCKSCVRRHLQAQLETHGRQIEGRMTCPLCSRALAEQEIRTLASKETIQTYDHYLLLSYLSKEPDFRYCLNNGCNSGQVYEQSEYADPHITCDECNFEMCFAHQIPWHQGLSCSQYDAQRIHGDPRHDENQEWIKKNSKTCPGAGCNINIEKGNACFHMTCTQCRHEFCWECLGDWKQISPQPGTHVKTAHKEGCWFRNGQREPTEVRGITLSEAMRRSGL